MGDRIVPLGFRVAGPTDPIRINLSVIKEEEVVDPRTIASVETVKGTNYELS